MSEMTKTQLDRLGDRIRKGSISEEDLRLLDAPGKRAVRARTGKEKA